jgi:hypothetical protein
LLNQEQENQRKINFNTWEKENSKVYCTSSISSFCIFCVRLVPRVGYLSAVIGSVMKRDLNIKGRSYYQNLRTKFLASAKEAASSGDRILSEYNLQIAEHYARVISERFGSQRESRQFQERGRESHPSKKNEESRPQRVDTPVEASKMIATGNTEKPVSLQKVRRVRVKPTERVVKLEDSSLRQEPIDTDTVVKKRRVSRKVKKDQS